MSDYVTIAELEAAANAPAGFLELGPLAITAASRAIDDYCKRRFDKATETRYYSPDYANVLWLDDLVSITTLKTNPGEANEATIASTEWVLEPLNAPTRNEPYSNLRVKNSYWLPSGRRSVEIVGEFGWPAVPAPIKQAALIHASRLLKRSREAPFGVIAGDFEGGGMRVPRLDPDVAALLGPYQKLLVG